MGNRSLQDWITACRTVKPVEECLHLRGNARSRGRLEVNLLCANRPRYYLHRTKRIVSPRADPYAIESAAAGREHRHMPSEQPISRQCLCVVQYSIQRHLDYTLNVSLRRYKAACLDTKPLRD